MEGIELLKQQLKANVSSAAKRIGEYLIERFQADPVMEQKYWDNKIELINVLGYVKQTAMAKAKGETSVCVSDEDVYSWAVHYVDEGGALKVEQHKNSEKVAEKLQKEANAKAPIVTPKPSKPIPVKHVEQMSLFDVN